MSRYHCRRCDWQPAKDDNAPGPLSQLADHAANDGHPLCILCGQSLPTEDVRTCLPCIADTRRRLQAVADTYALLPEFRVRVSSPSDWRRSGPRSDEPPLPGGDPLVMLAGGSKGRSQDRGVQWAGGLDFSHAEDEHESDAPSVANELGSWEDDWRTTRGEPAAEHGATVMSALGYLMPRLSWAAETHDAFDEFATDLRRLLSRLETATATDERADSGAACIDCGTDLQRGYADPKPCGHDRPTQELMILGYRRPEPTENDPDPKPVPIRETIPERDLRLEQWAEKHTHCDQGGQETVWRCPNPRCQRTTYDPGEYGLAVGMSMRAKRDDAHYWVPVAVAARLVDRTQAVVKRWAEDDEHPVLMVCDLKTRRLRVLLASVFRASDAKARRNRVA